MRAASFLPFAILALLSACGGEPAAPSDAGPPDAQPASIEHCLFEQLPATAGAGGTVTAGTISAGAAERTISIPVSATLGVQRTTTPDQIRTWIDYALANKLWLILTFHRVEKTLDDCEFKDGAVDHGCTDIATLKAVADYLKDMPDGTVKTVADVLRDKDEWVARAPSEGTAGTTSTGLCESRRMISPSL